MTDHNFMDPIGTCDACGSTPQHVRTFGGFLLCAECYEWAEAETGADESADDSDCDHCAWGNCDRHDWGLE